MDFIQFVRTGGLLAVSAYGTLPVQELELGLGWLALVRHHLVLSQRAVEVDLGRKRHGCDVRGR